MYLKRAQHSRLKKQWRFLSKQLKQLTEQGKFQALATAKKVFLQGRLKRLFQQMLRFEKASRLRKALGATALLLGLQVTPLAAQVTFGPLITDPFGLSPMTGLGGIHNDGLLADIDGDDDLDLITLNHDVSQGLNLWENMSNNEGATANFVEPVPHFGEVILPELHEQSINKFDFGDLDNDGDLDLIMGTAVWTTNDKAVARLYYFENTGDINTPVFPEFVTMPFNIDLNNSRFYTPFLRDIDNDGDLDLMSISNGDYYNSTFQYFENIGTAEAADFAPPQQSPFGLPNNASEYVFIDFGDIDNDGDLDALAGDRTTPISYGTDFFDYIENMGTAENPQFTIPVEGAFSILTMGTYVRPILGDLDNDGDLDMLGSLYFELDCCDRYWPYWENLLNPLTTKEPMLAAEATVLPSVSNSVVNLSVQTETVQSYFLINVFAMNGKLLHQHKMAGGTFVNQQIDLSTYPAGQYLIQVRTPDGVLVRKAIKQ